MVSYITFGGGGHVLIGLNPYCSGRWSRTRKLVAFSLYVVICLNPYCSGRWSRTSGSVGGDNGWWCLNPYCSGRWSRTPLNVPLYLLIQVLILIVVEDGLVLILLCMWGHCRLRLNPYCSGRWSRTATMWIIVAWVWSVLILIVVEDGLVPVGRSWAYNPSKS